MHSRTQNTGHKNTIKDPGLDLSKILGGQTKILGVGAKGGKK